MEATQDIRQIKLSSLSEFFTDNGSPSFRAKQVFEWIWTHYQLDFKKMTTLTLKERELLIKNFHVNQAQIVNEKKSQDGTRKFLFQIDNKKTVEGVLIPQLNRLTACISSQAGCSLACKFCATGQLKLYRNLTCGEIYDQVFLLNNYATRNLGKPITNIVFMGMGEPLLNINNVLKSIHHITGKYGMGISGKRITVSTVGITKIIRKIADESPNFNLAISLHAASDKKRSEIMDINKTNDLNSLLDSLDYFYNKTRIKPTYEYILLKDFNDTVQDAKDLISICRKIPSKINLIEYNSVKNVPYEKSKKDTVSAFIKMLEKNNILVKIRKSRGEDIAAACGQLSTQYRG